MNKSSGSTKMSASPSKPQKTLLHFFQNKNNPVTQMPKVSCPGCNLQIPESRINWHLDHDCKSKTLKKAKTRKKKSCNSKVEHKSKLKRAILSDSEEDFEIDILQKVKNKVADLKAENSNLNNSVNRSTSTTRDLITDWTSPETTPIKIHMYLLKKKSLDRPKPALLTLTSPKLLTLQICNVTQASLSSKW